ncbi:hypothetical protein QBC35DRAFT_452227 [Podospora australis]|uniref:Uncharacterized protein n=1 Tax=Podospora australis TaxID=1536484 RepID=A0AAN6WSR0_9PEZI|nr:hypothetical protein QBC35DRAFT_452227 [Podospora australis]
MLRLNDRTRASARSKARQILMLALLLNGCYSALLGASRLLHYFGSQDTLQPSTSRAVYTGSLQSDIFTEMTETICSRNATDCHNAKLWLELYTLLEQKIAEHDQQRLPTIQHQDAMRENINKFMYRNSLRYFTCSTNVSVVCCPSCPAADSAVPSEPFCLTCADTRCDHCPSCQPEVPESDRASCFGTAERVNRTVDLACPASYWNIGVGYQPKTDEVLRYKLVSGSEAAFWEHIVRATGIDRAELVLGKNGFPALKYETPQPRDFASSVTACPANHDLSHLP